MRKCNILKQQIVVSDANLGKLNNLSLNVFFQFKNRKLESLI